MKRAIRADLAHTSAQQRIMGAYLALPHERIPASRAKRARGGFDPLSKGQARAIRDLLPTMVAPETKVKHFALGKIPCQHCGVRNRGVDPDARSCFDQVACAKRAEDWR